MQTGFRWALERDYDLAVRLDGDGQHDATQLRSCSGRSPETRRTSSPARASARTRTDIGRPSAGASGSRGSPPRLPPLRAARDGHDIGFQALNRKGIALFARDYPSDYPEVEATVLVLKHRLRLVEVPVHMREREHGSSSITFLRSVYYAIKVTLALFVAMGRRYAVPSEGVQR